jgi:hypothetical protein
VFATQLLEFRRETLRLLAPSDLLPDVVQLVLDHPASTAEVAGPEGTAPAREPTIAVRLALAARGAPSAYAAAAAWAATADELVTRGITNRPSLIIAEVTALVLTPIAVYESAGRGEAK